MRSLKETSLGRPQSYFTVSNDDSEEPVADRSRVLSREEGGRKSWGLIPSRYIRNRRFTFTLQWKIIITIVGLSKTISTSYTQSGPLVSLNGRRRGTLDSTGRGETRGQTEGRSLSLLSPPCVSGLDPFVDDPSEDWYSYSVSIGYGATTSNTTPLWVGTHFTGFLTGTKTS